MNKLGFKNRFYGLDIDEKVNIRQLRGLQVRNSYADGGYVYFLKLKEGSKFITSHALSYKKVTIEKEKGNIKVSISVTPDLGSKSVNVKVAHKIILYSKENFFEEKIVIENLSDKECRFEDMRFGFNSHIKNIKDLSLIAVPFGYPDDATNKKILLNGNEPWISNPQERYTMEEFLLNGRRCGAEGWLLQGKEGGILIVKHSPDMVEYSVIDSLDSVIRFGGVGIFRRDPEEAYLLPPKGRIEFGVTRYIFYRGDWKEGFYQFREYMSSMGHTFKKDYNPPIHWNVIYNLGWKKYSLKDVKDEAKLGRDVGCESIYLDPCWNTIEGGEVWDEGRFGSLKVFVSRMKNKYKLKVALHTMSNVGPNWSPDNSFSRVNKEYPGCFRKDSKGKPYNRLDGCWAICQGSSEWKKEKLKRLKRLIEDGVEFLMFDFCLFDNDMENCRSCWDDSHGHKVPLTKTEHVKGMMEVIQKIKEEFQHVLIESHDGLVGGRYSSYHPLYFRYNWPNSFDELWGFENMWEPVKDILTGNGRTLYYYNLAYKIPLYLHIDCGKDTLSQLEFWWYASVVRHLGIGGVKDPSSPKYKALKESMKRYKRLKDFYTRGEFYGIDETVHIHTLTEKNEAVINAFNLGAKKVVKKIEIDLIDIGLNPKKITGVENLPFKKNGPKLFIDLKIPALSPVLGMIK